MGDYETKTYMEDIIALWGKEFYDLCYQDAYRVRESHAREFGVDTRWGITVPGDLILAAAIQRLRKQLSRE